MNSFFDTKRLRICHIWEVHDLLELDLFSQELSVVKTRLHFHLSELRALGLFIDLACRFFLWLQFLRLGLLVSLFCRLVLLLLLLLYLLRGALGLFLFYNGCLLVFKGFSLYFSLDVWVRILLRILLRRCFFIGIGSEAEVIFLVDELVVE